LAVCCVSFAEELVVMPSRIDGATCPLTLRQCIIQALESNLQVQVEGFFPLIDDQSIEIERAVFDPVWSAGASQTGYQHFERIIWSPAGRQLNRDRNDQFYTGLRKFLSTGGEISLKYQDDRMENSLFRPQAEYYSGLGLQLKQPLLQGFGKTSAFYGLRISQKNREISSRVFDQTLLGISHDVVSAYWDLTLSRKDVEIKRQSLELAQDLLGRNKERSEVGMLPSYELLENESQVALRNEHLLRAVNELQDSNDQLATLLNLVDRNSGEFHFVPVEEVGCPPHQPSASASLELALQRRPEIHQASLNIQRSELRVAYIRKRRLPTLNLITGLGLHGFDGNLGNSQDDLFNDETYDWNVGLVFELPLGGREGRHQVRKALLQKQQALLQREALEQRIVAEIREAVRQVQTDQERIRATASARSAAQERLEVEQSLYEQGMSTTHDLLEYQEDLSVAQLEELRAQIDYRKALARLRYVEGTILDEFGIEFGEQYLPQRDDWDF